MTQEFQSKVLDLVEQSQRLIDEKQAAIEATKAERSAYLAGVPGTVKRLIEAGLATPEDMDKLASDLSDPQTALDFIHLLSIKLASALTEATTPTVEAAPTETFGTAVDSIAGEKKQASVAKDDAFIAAWLNTAP